MYVQCLATIFNEIDSGRECESGSTCPNQYRHCTPDAFGWKQAGLADERPKKADKDGETSERSGHRNPDQWHRRLLQRPLRAQSGMGQETDRLKSKCDKTNRRPLLWKLAAEIARTLELNHKLIVIMWLHIQDRKLNANRVGNKVTRTDRSTAGKRSPKKGKSWSTPIPTLRNSPRNQRTLQSRRVTNHFRALPRPNLTDTIRPHTAPNPNHRKHSENYSL